MSARPRPVTATVTKLPDFMPLMPKTADLSSGSETASLVSVLDHDSYVSPEPSDGEDEVVQSKPEEPSSLKTNSDHDKENTNLNTSYTISSTTEPPTATNTETKQRKIAGRADSQNGAILRNGVISGNGAISPWETWMIEKAKEIRIHQRQEVQHLQQLQQEEEKKKEKEKSKKEKVNEQVKQWMEKKAVEEDLRTSLQKQREEAAILLQQEKKRQIEEKADIKYKEWLNEKQTSERNRRAQERQRKKEEAHKKEEQRQKSEKAFEEWKKKATKRPCSAPNSFGYISGQLTSYHDRNSYPVPSFYNPMPWQPIHVPQPKKTPKPKAKPKRVWNPQKYL